MPRSSIWVAGTLAVVTAVLLPFAGSVPGPASVTFLPFFLTAVLIIEGMTALLLVFQFMAEGDRRLLLLATAYAWTALVILPHAIVFPGVVFAETPWAAASAAVWLWVAWHVGFPALVATAMGPWWIKSGRRFVPAGERRRTAARTFGAEALVLIGVALIAARTEWLPAVIAQGDYQKLTRDFGWIILGVNIAAVAIVARGWSMSNRMEKWVLVAVVACAGDVFLTLFAEGRFTAGWYAGRLMNLISACTLLVAILVDTNRLYGQMAATSGALRTQAHTDPLTGLLNRRAYDVHAEDLRRTAPVHQQQLSILSFDVDHFKAINDKYGHGTGDDVLVECARRLGETARSGDLVFRFGGEEFVVLAPGASPADANSLAARCLEALRLPHQTRSGLLSVTVSAGCATLTGGESLEALADRALYVAKTSGRDRVVNAENLP